MAAPPENDLLTEKIIGFAIEVRRQGPLPVVYKRVHLDCGYRLDLVIEDQVILELKTVERLMPIHDAQLLTYLKLTGVKVGLLINFNVSVLKNGIKRVACGDLFKEETGGRGFAGQILFLLCAFVSLWFK